jgi:hypothetical protein
MTGEQLEVYAGYRQFYVFDADEPGDTGSSAFWTLAATQARLPVEAGVVGVATDTDGQVPVTLEMLAAEPQLSLEGWDHVAEASLQLSAGHLTIYGCPDEPTGLVVDAPAGSYRVRVSSVGLSATPDQLEYNGDSYLVQVWPAEVADRRVLKQFQGGASGD